MSRLMVLGTVTVLALSGCAGPAQAQPPAHEQQAPEVDVALVVDVPAASPDPTPTPATDVPAPAPTAAALTAPTQEQQARALDRAGDIDLIGEFQVVPDSDPIREDDPRWDCRTHGNQRCGVQVQGVWYVLDFATGTFVPR